MTAVTATEMPYNYPQMIKEVTKMNLLKIKIIAPSLFSFGIALMGFSAQAAQLHCQSSQKAKAYRNSTGRWSLNAEISSEFRLKNISLKNSKHAKLGALTEAAIYDRRSLGLRNFRVAPDVFCNYELQLPREFSKTSVVQAELVQTCDDLFDATVNLGCRIQ
jgi:hypothetical protein